MPKEEIRAQIQAAGAAELGMWMVNGIINDARLDMFYADLTAAAKTAK